jgi:hypothetical protein
MFRRDSRHQDSRPARIVFETIQFRNDSGIPGIKSYARVGNIYNCLNNGDIPLWTVVA